MTYSPTVIGPSAALFDSADGLRRNFASYADVGHLLKMLAARLGHEPIAALALSASAAVLEDIASKYILSGTEGAIV